MATRAEKIAWAFEQYGPEGVYMDGEVSGKAAEDHAVDLYNRAHKTGGYVDCPTCKGTGSLPPTTQTSGGSRKACPTCWTWGVVKEDRSAGRWCEKCQQFGSHHTDKHGEFRR